MIEIKIPQTIKVGGFDYSIEFSERHDEELDDAGCYGQCNTKRKRIRIGSYYDSQQTSATFIHEVIHAINDIYGAETNEQQNRSLGNGLFQVLEQLGIRFMREVKDASD